MCVCMLPRNLGKCFISLLVAAKNVSPDKKIVAIFEKKFLVAEKLVSHSQAHPTASEEKGLVN